MSDPYIGEIRLFAGTFAPQGWSFCNGSLLPISDYSALFQLIGTTYGGDGQTTFGLPDLRGRIPVGQGNGAGLSSRTIGQSGGEENHSLSMNEMASHNHTPSATTATATTVTAGNSVLYAAVTPNVNNYGLYSTQVAPSVTMAPGAISPVGGNQPHTNLMPTLAISFIISLNGIYPSQS